MNNKYGGDLRRCPTGKRTFRTIAQAKKLMKERGGQNFGARTRIYKCDRCTGFHMTRKEANKTW